MKIFLTSLFFLHFAIYSQNIKHEYVKFFNTKNQDSIGKIIIERSFNEKKQIIEEINYCQNMDDLKNCKNDYNLRTTYEYNRHTGELIREKKYFNLSDKAFSVSQFNKIYNKRDSLIVEIIDVKNIFSDTIFENEKKVKTYEYDEDGKIIYETIQNANSLYSDELSTVFAYENYYAKSGKLKKYIKTCSNGQKEIVNYKYDEKGNCIEIKYNQNWVIDNVLCLYNCKYDSKNNLIEEQECYTDGSTYVTFYQYDSKNKKIKETRSNISSNYSNVKEYKYDEKNGLLLEIKDLIIDKNESKVESIIKYEYHFY